MKGARTGFAMIEVVMSVAIIGGIAVGALMLVASAAQQKTNAANIARGQMLCRSLAEEICTRPVTDWSDNSGLSIKIVGVGGVQVVGSDARPITLTLGLGNRLLFDTVDDYAGYKETPPLDESGNAMPGYTDWKREVTVEVADLLSPDTNDARESGLRRVTVSSYYQGRLVASTTFLRSSEWERVQP